MLEEEIVIDAIATNGELTKSQKKILKYMLLSFGFEKKIFKRKKVSTDLNISYATILKSVQKLKEESFFSNYVLTGKTCILQISKDKINELVKIHEKTEFAKKSVTESEIKEGSE